MTFGGHGDPAEQRPASRPSPPAPSPYQPPAAGQPQASADQGPSAPYQPQPSPPAPAAQPPYTQPAYAQPQYAQPQYLQQPQYVQPQSYPQTASTPIAPVYGSVLAQRPEHHGAVAYDAYTPPAPVQAVPALPVPSAKGRHASVWAFGALGFVLLGLIAYFVWALGPAASMIGMVLALVPLTIVFFGVFFIDRWEPEPKSLVAFAIAWGAIASVGLALVVDLLLTLLLGQRNDDLTAVLQAPLVEETAKGLGVFLIFLMARRSFDGPIDGVVYGALVGAGFAFTENIQYFAVSLIEGGAPDLTVTFVLRGLMSPFAHAMFTSVTGFAIGLAARRGASAARALGFGAVGLLGAMALHALWNGSSMIGNFFVLYIVLQVPLFVGFIVVIILLRKEESRLTYARLSDYATAGWFTPQEVSMLATPAGRRVGLRWASGLRGDRRPIMRRFIKDATTLASVRQRIITGRDPLATQDEQVLLQRTHAARDALLSV
ncbi:PrsW family intramembrane metalloprotease [Microbacterium sp. MYb64]|uniref:PrsW family intramembrane metalloprotease n=1 Tax=Microbacterium sp. MYb64 TaxID=1848691 RepID=UPI000CFB10B6|nr:PrsW family intramembrane metalloprotease [Microbacterium sp. MYb64]PRB08403.1 PrsW family intramembrane metalloprotease [Microbacterium sp. MYb64]